MKTPIVRLTIGQTVSLSGTALDYDGKPVQVNQRFQAEYTAREYIAGLRDEQGYEFQLVMQRDCADFKRNMVII